MASITVDSRRGTWHVKWRSADGWKKVKVADPLPTWRIGQPMPKRPPLEAVKALAKFQQLEQDASAQRQSPTRSVRLADFLAAHRAAKAPVLRAPSVALYGKVHAEFLRWCSARRIELVEQVTPEVCELWLTERLATVKASTATTDRAYLQAAWRRGVKLRMIPENPWEHTTRPRFERVKKASWTPEEFDRLLAASRPYLRDILLLGVHTGFRIRALLGLEWRDVQFNQDAEVKSFGRIHLRPEMDKGKRGLVLPMDRVANEVLRRRYAVRSREHDRVLANAYGRASDQPSTGVAILRACRRAGLPEIGSPNHAMRRTFGRWCVHGHMSGTPIPIYVVSRFLGHASVEQTESYLDIEKDLGEKWLLGE